MTQEIASILIFAGAVTVLMMPLLASITYRVADMHPVVAVKEITRNPHNYLYTLSGHRQMGKIMNEARQMSADEIMDKKARMVEIHNAAVDHIERALAHESPETVRRYIDEMYRELSETVPDAYHEKLAHEMTSWYP